MSLVIFKMLTKSKNESLADKLAKFTITLDAPLPDTMYLIIDGKLFKWSKDDGLRPMPPNEA